MKANLNGCHSLSDFRVFAQIAGPFPHTVELSWMDGRNELFRSSRITLKKSFPKFIKKSSHNRFLKMGLAHVGASEKKLLNLPIILSKSMEFTIGFHDQKSRSWKNTTFFSGQKMPQLLESIARRIFYRFWKTFFQSGCIFAGKSKSAIKTDPDTI